MAKDKDKQYIYIVQASKEQTKCKIVKRTTPTLKGYAGPVDLFNQGPKGYVFTKNGYEEMDFSKEFPNDYNGSFDHPILSGLLKKGYKYAQDREYVPYIDGKRCFGRVLVQKN